MVCVCPIEKLATVPTKWSTQTHTCTRTRTPNPALRVRKQRPDSSCLNPDPLEQTNNTAQPHSHSHTYTLRLIPLWSSAIASTSECPTGSKIICSLDHPPLYGCACLGVCMCECTCARWEWPCRVIHCGYAAAPALPQSWLVSSVYMCVSVCVYLLLLVLWGHKSNQTVTLWWRKASPKYLND